MPSPCRLAPTRAVLGAICPWLIDTRWQAPVEVFDRGPLPRHLPTCSPRVVEAIRDQSAGGSHFSNDFGKCILYIIAIAKRWSGILLWCSLALPLEEPTLAMI